MASLIDEFLPTVPSLPDIPDADGLLGPGVTDFEDFSTFTACTEKQVVFTAKTLKLQSATITGRVLISKLRSLLAPFLERDQSFIPVPEIGELNLDMSISKITSPKVNELPKCLSDTITGDVTSLVGGSDMKDILDPFNKGIDGLNSLTGAASGAINSMANSFTSNIEKGVGEVNKMMEKTMGNIVAPGDKVLFSSLDKFQQFVNETNYVENYKEWRDMYKCLQTNCKPLEPFLLNDDFLYYDDTHKNFIMPIDTNTGRVIIHKFFEDLTRDESKQAGLLQMRYDKYLDDKREVLSKAAQKAKKSGVKDDKNPFSAAAGKLSEAKTDLVNNLF